jgi:hypothetical protein
MRVIDVELVTAERVEVEDADWQTYRRYSADCWDALMGMSWEEVYNCDDLEEAYQAFQRRTS